jgi:hypothetical protein
VPPTRGQEEVAEAAEVTAAVVVAAAVERRTRWAAADTSAVVDTSAAACVLAVRLMLAALRAWAEVGHISEADRISARVISAADQRDRGLAAERRECDLLRGPVSVLSGFMLRVRSQRTAQTETPRSIVEITKLQTSAETGTQVSGRGRCGMR